MIWFVYFLIFRERRKREPECITYLEDLCIIQASPYNFYPVLYEGYRALVGKDIEIRTQLTDTKLLFLT